MNVLDYSDEARHVRLRRNMLLDVIRNNCKPNDRDSWRNVIAAVERAMPDFNVRPEPTSDDPSTTR